MTLKKALLRGLLGAPIGVFISYTITILISLFHLGEGIYSPVVPELVNEMGNEIYAVLMQYILSALLGFGFATGSAVFQVEQWSITKQTVIHFIISVTAMFPTAYFRYWIDHTVGGVLFYMLTFVILYVVIWVIQINIWKRRIQDINNGIGRR